MRMFVFIVTGDTAPDFLTYSVGGAPANKFRLLLEIGDADLWGGALPCVGFEREGSRCCLSELQWGGAKKTASWKMQVPPAL